MNHERSCIEAIAWTVEHLHVVKGSTAAYHAGCGGVVARRHGNPLILTGRKSKLLVDEFFRILLAVLQSKVATSIPVVNVFSKLTVKVIRLLGFPRLPIWLSQNFDSERFTIGMISGSTLRALEVYSIYHGVRIGRILGPNPGRVKPNRLAGAAVAKALAEDNPEMWACAQIAEDGGVEVVLEPYDSDRLKSGVYDVCAYTTGLSANPVIVFLAAFTPRSRTRVGDAVAVALGEEASGEDSSGEERV